jgi:hypothetical protein
MNIEQTVMTPEMAKYFLGMNTSNRKMRKTAVETFVRKIKNGEWLVTHQGIAVSKAGVILDGQHRLQAIVDSNTAVPVLIARNCDDQLFHAIDCGTPRNNADLTRLPPRVVEMLTCIANIAFTGRKKATPGEILHLYQLFGAECDELLEFAPSSKRGVTAAPIRAAAVILMAEGKYPDYVKSAYRAMTLLDFEVLPRVTQILTKQLMVNGAATEKQTNLFCKSLKALDKEEANSGTCSFTEGLRDRSFARVKKLVND